MGLRPLSVRIGGSSNFPEVGADSIMRLEGSVVRNARGLLDHSVERRGGEQGYGVEFPANLEDTWISVGSSYLLERRESFPPG